MGVYSNAIEQIHLIFHQGDKWGNYNCSAFLHNGRQLVAKGFSCPGRHNYKCVFPGHQVLNDFFLVSPEFIETEDLF